MKKIIFTVAVLATMLASCSKNEVYDVVGTREDSPINFTNLNDKVTRSANDSKSNYKVYAKSTLSGETAWFINDEVKDDNSTESGNIYFWPSGATVDFYAWAPSTVTATASTYSNLSIDYTVPAGADEDFTVAAPETGLSSGTVEFKFSHMLTKITVSAELTSKLTAAGYSMTFTSASLGVNSKGGTLTPTATTPAWTSPANNTSATYSGAKSYMVMPQSSENCTVKLVGVTITKGGATVFSGNMKTYTIATGNVTDNAFAKGSHYNLKLTVDAKAHDDGGEGGGTESPVFGDQIQFSAELAAEWGSGTDTPLTQQ